MDITITHQSAFEALLKHETPPILDEYGQTLSSNEPYTAVLSIIGTWTIDCIPGGSEVWGAYPARHKLLLVFDDQQQSDEHGDAPTPDHVAKIIAFGRALPADARLLVHCAAGISRSTAAALIILAVQHPRDTSEEVVERLKALRGAGTMRPHRNMVNMADRALGYGGLLLQARDAVWGPR